MNNCPYCNKKKFDEESFCSLKCENKYNKFLEKEKKQAKYFFIGIAFALAIPIIGTCLNNTFLAYLCIPILSLTLLFCPFATPETVETIGVKMSIIITRIIAIGILFLNYFLLHL